MRKSTFKYPASVLAHWSSGPVPACVQHAAALVGLGRFMGLHVAVTTLQEPAECANCVNEAKQAAFRDPEPFDSPEGGTPPADAEDNSNG